MRLLLIEDSDRLRATLERGLRKAGYAVDVAKDGREGLWLATENDYDLIVLDLMIPEIDGLTVLSTLRERGKESHVLILSAKDRVEDRIAGLGLGADDYLVKPFSFDELCARLQALVRRSYRAKNPVLRLGDLEVHTAARQVRYGGRPVELTPREFSLLEILALRAGEVVSRRELWESLYEFESEATSNVVDALVYSLRKKLGSQGPGSLIRTGRGEGYVLERGHGVKSLRGRLTAGLLVGSGLLLVAGGLVLRGAIASSLQREFDQALIARTLSLVGLTEQQDGRVWIDLNDEVMPEFRSREKPIYFEAWFGDGRVLARSASLGRADLPRAGAPLDRVRLADGVLPDGRAGRRAEIRFHPQFEALEDEGREGKPRPSAAPEPGVAPVTLVVAQGREELDAFLHSIDVTLALVILGLLAGVAALTTGVLALGLRPLDELARRLEAMDAGTLGQDLELSWTPAELQPVVRHLQGLLARLKDSFERERAFSSNLAHELRTPLTELRAAAEVALKWPEDSPGWLASFEEVRAIGLQMERVVENLLALARCEEREAAVELSEVSLHELALAGWRNLAAEAAAKGMELALAVPQDLRLVTDGAKLTLILSNLLGNAVAHGAPGSRVELSAAATGKEFSFTVRNATDTLTPGDLPRLFDRFWRKDTARSDGRHAGLGLSLVAALGDLLGFHPEARLEGRTFEITLTGPVDGRRVRAASG